MSSSSSKPFSSSSSPPQDSQRPNAADYALLTTFRQDSDNICRELASSALNSGTMGSSLSLAFSTTIMQLPVKTRGEFAERLLGSILTVPCLEMVGTYDLSIHCNTMVFAGETKSFVLV